MGPTDATAAVDRVVLVTDFFGSFAA